MRVLRRWASNAGVLVRQDDTRVDNTDTKYKQKVLEICENAYRFENVTKSGELELVFDENTSVSCSLIFEGEWETNLSKLIAEATL